MVPRPRRSVAFERRESVYGDDADCPDLSAALHARARPRSQPSGTERMVQQTRFRQGAMLSFADGFVVSDVDWESKDGHYRVRLEGRWIDVPDDAVITEPNRAGRTMVWPYAAVRGTDPPRTEIRCFMPGSMG
jgi:hypothetical protein